MSTEWPFYEDTLDCVHCGLCLPACPTYDVLGLETDSPRGRVFLMRALAEGRLAEPTAIRPHLDQCLGCRACESLCPSGVPYGEILEDARGRMADRWPKRGLSARLQRFLLDSILVKQGRLRLAFSLLRVAEVLGLRRVAKLLGGLPRRAAELLPRVPAKAQRRDLSGTYEPEGGEVRGRVALFTGCVMEQVFGDLNRQTLDLLLANGFAVDVPASQVCCGALHLHNEGHDRARRLAEENCAVFADAEVVIHNSAGCGAAMRGYDHLLGTPAAAALAGKTRDICEFLAEVGLVKSPRPYPHKVAYDDPCHLAHGQGVRAQPRELLQQVPDLVLVTPRRAERCCGAGGIFNLTQPELAAEIGQEKVADLLATGAEVIASGNPGCLMQLRAHLSRVGEELPVVHPVELLLP